ncbi:hypothetical protein [Methanoregula sp.]|uniref:hypothetical protein n=1 Tax=Methanoregula sp. TaxID=2052170 RepID=UPI00236DB469|nr:hypothetical protein [Methanoregula sp.]MDD1686293.1 hypothetical protein [Methanoregula sp.]
MFIRVPIPIPGTCQTAAITGTGSHVHVVTDEVSGSGELDALLDTLATRLVQCADAEYIPPKTFYAIGGHKIFRDTIYGGMRFVIQADYRYYMAHGMFDFPQGGSQGPASQCSPRPVDKDPRFPEKSVCRYETPYDRAFRTRA